MPINEKGRYYIGRGKNIKHIVTAISKEEHERNNRKKEYGVKIQDWVEALSDGCPPEIAKALIRRKYGTVTDHEEKTVMSIIEKNKKENEDRDEGR